MTNEKLYELLGDINEKHVKEAREYRKAKKPVWLKWCAVAACLCLVLVGTFVMKPDNGSYTGDDAIVSSGVADVVPMVYVNNILYKQSVKQVSYTEIKPEFIYVGKIESDITNDQSTSFDGVPAENFQANHSIVGAEVYQYDNDIVVHING